MFDYGVTKPHILPSAFNEGYVMLRKLILISALLLSCGSAHADPFGQLLQQNNINPAPTVKTLIIDGNGTATGTTSPPALSLTTTRTNDTIVLLIQLTNNTGGAAPSVTSISDTAGLTWASREVLAFTTGGGNAIHLEEWYAVSSGILTSDAISLTLGGGAVGAGRVSAVAINGANLSTPFDPNVSLAASTSSTTGSTPSVTISTTKAKDILFNYLGDGSGSVSLGTVTRPSGFSQILSTGTFSDFSSSIVSTMQSSVAMNFSFSGGSNGYYMILDAIQASGQ